MIVKTIPLAELQHKYTEIARKQQHPIWTKVEPDSARSIPEFISPNFDDDDVYEPIDFFRMFFNDSVLKNIVYQSNLYATQKNANTPLKLNIEEMEPFIGISMYTPIFDSHRTRNYWAEAFRLLQIADTMVRERYEVIRKYLHFNDNSNMVQE